MFASQGQREGEGEGEGEEINSLSIIFLRFALAVPAALPPPRVCTYVCVRVCVCVCYVCVRVCMCVCNREGTPHTSLRVDGRLE